MTLRAVIAVFCDAVLAVLALAFAAGLRFGSFEIPADAQVDQVLTAGALFVFVVLFSSYLMEVYSLPRGSRKRDIFVTCLQGGCAAFFFLSVAYYIHPSVMIGRGVLFFALGFFLFFQFSWHALSRMPDRKAPFAQRVLILGSGEVAHQLGGLITSQSGAFTLAGYLECGESADPAGTAHLPEHFSQVVQKEGDLLETALKHRVSIIVVALAERRGVLPLQEMMRCKLNGIEVLDAPTFYEVVQGKLMLEEITPSWIIFSTGFRTNALVILYKRFVDILLSVAGLLLSLPFFPLVALAIKLESPGPLFFKQVRVGKGEKPFLLYKFRSMRQDAEKNGAVWAVKNDSRVTRVGRFLRNSRIDELPQLYNVLKGDMSFIGPRPERPEFVENLKKDIYYYSKRHTIKPGLTGWAQVCYPYGATVEDAVEKLRYDLYYIKNLSFFLDMKIMFETVKVVLFGRGR